MFIDARIRWFIERFDKCKMKDIFHIRLNTATAFAVQMKSRAKYQVPEIQMTITRGEKPSFNHKISLNIRADYLQSRFVDLFLKKILCILHNTAMETRLQSCKYSPLKVL